MIDHSLTPVPSLPEALSERIAAAAVAEGLADAVYERAPSPLGDLVVVLSGAGVCRIAFPEEPLEHVLGGVAGVLGPRVVRSRAETGAARDALGAYLEGDAGALALEVDLRLERAPFRRKVLEALRAVPRGETVSYGQLASRAGRERAARAAGTACARNPVPILVPCHRVLPASGALGGYAGGPERKRALLALEGALESS